VYQESAFGQGFEKPQSNKIILENIISVLLVNVTVRGCLQARSDMEINQCEEQFQTLK